MLLVVYLEMQLQPHLFNDRSIEVSSGSFSFFDPQPLKQSIDPRGVPGLLRFGCNSWRRHMIAMVFHLSSPGVVVIHFVASGAAPPVSDISGRKLLCSTSRMRCCYFTFFTFWWCLQGSGIGFLILSKGIKKFTSKRHGMKSRPQRRFGVKSMHFSSSLVVDLLQSQSFYLVTVEGEVQFRHRGTQYPRI